MSIFVDLPRSLAYGLPGSHNFFLGAGLLEAGLLEAGLLEASLLEAGLLEADFEKGSLEEGSLEEDSLESDSLEEKQKTKDQNSNIFPPAGGQKLPLPPIIVFRFSTACS